MTLKNLSKSYEISGNTSRTCCKDLPGSTGFSKIKLGISYKEIFNYCKQQKTVIITDKNVFDLYFSSKKELDIIVIDTGEKIKNLETAFYIYEKFLEFEVDRKTLVIGVGGGIVCDIAGFCASTYLRGIQFGFVASTLLSQVDASIGGKNGVNFKSYKNMIGVFNQPSFVFCDIDMLKTLPREELLCGFAEIIKHAFISGNKMIEYLELNYDEALKLSKKVIFDLIDFSICIKSEIVNSDETEKGCRAILNFGHSLGHALQTVLGLNHGRAVGLGMVFSLFVSYNKYYISKQDFEKGVNLINKYGLDLFMDFDLKAVLDSMKKDKKMNNGEINFILLKKFGHAIIQPMNFEEIENNLNDMCKYFRQ